MKWLRTLIIFDSGNIAKTKDWRDIHSSYVRSTKSITHPSGTKKLTIRRKTRTAAGDWKRNGVVYLRKEFLNHLSKKELWLPESATRNAVPSGAPSLLLFPSLKPYHEPITSEFGEFDFETNTKGKLRVAIEWETGNISSSHRSMNKLAIALGDGSIHIGILVVPSRALYEHLTDRIGNIGELSGYLRLWQSIRHHVKRGLLAITVVEHDKLTDDPSISYLKAGSDGRSHKKR